MVLNWRITLCWWPSQQVPEQRGKSVAKCGMATFTTAAIYIKSVCKLYSNILRRGGGLTSTEVVTKISELVRKTQHMNPRTKNNNRAKWRCISNFSEDKEKQIQSPNQLHNLLTNYAANQSSSREKLAVFYGSPSVDTVFTAVHLNPDEFSPRHPFQFKVHFNTILSSMFMPFVRSVSISFSTRTQNAFYSLVSVVTAHLELLDAR